MSDWAAWLAAQPEKQGRRGRILVGKSNGTRREIGSRVEREQPKPLPPIDVQKRWSSSNQINRHQLASSSKQTVASPNGIRHAELITRHEGLKWDSALSAFVDRLGMNERHATWGQDDSVSNEQRSPIDPVTFRLNQPSRYLIFSHSLASLN